MIRRIEKGIEKDIGTVKKYSSKDGLWKDCQFVRRFDALNDNWIDVWALECILNVNLPECIYDSQRFIVDNIEMFNTIVVNLFTQDEDNSYDESFNKTIPIDWDSGNQVYTIQGQYCSGRVEEMLEVDYYYSDTYDTTHHFNVPTRVAIDYIGYITVKIVISKEESSITVSCTADPDDFWYEYSFMDIGEPDYFNIELSDLDSAKEVAKNEVSKYYYRAEQSTLAGQITLKRGKISNGKEIKIRNS